MIDKLNRARFAEGLRHLISGTITNDQFEDWPYQTSKDAAITEIFTLAAWPLYDDTKEHRLTNEYALTEGMKLDLARCILFLRSDLEYEWPRRTGIRASLRKIHFGNPWLKCGGDMTVWPFFRKKDYQATKSSVPPFLNGSRNEQVGSADPLKSGDIE